MLQVHVSLRTCGFKSRSEHSTHVMFQASLTPSSILCSSASIVVPMLTTLRSLPPSTFVRAVPYAIMAAVFMGIPSDIIDTPIFGRPVELRTIDYVIWLISSALIGFTFAVRLPNSHRDAEETNDRRTAWLSLIHI